MNSHPPINMQLLRKSRKIQKPGDIFTLQLPDKRYVFGRVIRTDVNLKPLLSLVTKKKKPDEEPKMLLVYIYKVLSNNKNDVPKLDKNELLIPPQVINRLGWARGYFETITNQLLQKEDILSQHCFLMVWEGKTYYFDEEGNRLPNRIEPCGISGVGNYRIIDDLVSENLGIPLASKE